MTSTVAHVRVAWPERLGIVLALFWVGVYALMCQPWSARGETWSFFFNGALAWTAMWTIPVWLLCRGGKWLFSRGA